MTARRDRRPLVADQDASPGAAQKDVLRDLMCVGPTSWRPETLLAVRHAGAAEPRPPRCVACGQPVSRRLRKTSTRCLTSDEVCLDAATEVCPVCDCRLTPHDDDDDDVFINAC